MNSDTQQKVIVIAAWAWSIGFLLSLVILGIYGIIHDGDVANSIIDTLQKIILSGVGAGGLLGSLHIWANRTTATATPAPVPAPAPAAQPIPVYQPTPAQTPAQA